MTVDREPWSDLISVDRVIELWQEGMKRFSPGEAPRSVAVIEEVRKCVKGAVGNAWSAMLYREHEGATHGLFLAAQLLFYLAKDHCFEDGNKRVAWLSSMEVCRSNRLTVAATDDEAEDLVIGIAGGKIGNVEEVTAWFAERLEWIN